jgi:hypothetical protein
MSFVFLSGYYIVCHLEKQKTNKIIATERKTNDKQYNRQRKKNK